MTEKRKAPRYPGKGKRYWERETPREADAGKVRLRYYPEAGRLQVVQLWTDENGELKPGKCVTLNVESLALAPQAKALLQQVLEDAI